MDDFTVSVRQLAQYPQVTPAPGMKLLAQAGIGSPYTTVDIGDLFAAALTSLTPVTINGWISAADLFMGPTAIIGWGVDPVSQTLYRGASGGLLGFTPGAGWRFDYATPDRAITVMQVTPAGNAVLPVGTVSVARWPACAGEVVSLDYFDCHTVQSFNGRIGPVCLSADDLAYAAGDAVATQCYVNEAISQAWQHWYVTTPLVFTFNGRVGDICLSDADISNACLPAGALARTNTAAPGDVSTRIANCAFVSGAIDDLNDQIQIDIDNAISGNYAPLNSPAFTGIPTAPTPNPGNTTGQLATTAFVMNAVAASTAGVASFNTRTGAVILEAVDVTNAGGALINSPAFTGIPTAATAVPGNSSTQLATTAFVAAALAAFVPSSGVLSFNTRTGAVVLSTADITGAGGAPLNNAGLTGIPTAPTAAPATSTTQLATTAFVMAAIAAATGVASFNGRTGAVSLQANDVSAVGGALIASPTFTGNPAAPTQNPGTSNTTLATTAFVTQAVSGVNLGVTSFNSRTGAVTLAAADITGAGGALLASPALTGVPTAPTPVTTSSDTTIATTAFVKAAISSSALVSSFNSRTGAVTLTSADVSGAGGALIASPTFTGVPAAPTATAGTSTTQLATTAFVAQAISTSGGVSSFNGRAGTVTLTPVDLIQANSGQVGNGFINKFRNGTFALGQRGTATTSIPTAGQWVYTLDGWYAQFTIGGTCTWQQVYNSNFRNYALRLTTTAGVASVSIMQRIESVLATQLFTPTLGVQMVTLQWRYFNGTSVTTAPQVAVYAPNAKDNYSATTQIVAASGLSSTGAGTGRVYGFSFMLDPAFKNGMEVHIIYGGAPYPGYLDFAEADIRATPWVTIANNEVAAANLPQPELRDIQSEYALCRRYYQSWINLSGGYFTNGAGVWQTYTLAPMRTTPTVAAQWTVTNADVYSVSPQSAATLQLTCYNSAGGIGINFNAQVQLSAEL